MTSTSTATTANRQPTGDSLAFWVLSRYCDQTHGFAAADENEGLFLAHRGDAPISAAYLALAHHDLRAALAHLEQAIAQASEPVPILGDAKRANLRAVAERDELRKACYAARALLLTTRSPSN